MIINNTNQNSTLVINPTKLAIQKGNKMSASLPSPQIPVTEDQIRYQLLTGVNPLPTLPPTVNGNKSLVTSPTTTHSGISSNNRSPHDATPQYRDLVTMVRYEIDPTSADLPNHLVYSNPDDEMYVSYLNGDHKKILSSKINSEFQYLLFLKTVYTSLSTDLSGSFLNTWASFTKFPKQTSLESWRLIELISSQLIKESGNEGQPLDKFTGYLKSKIKTDTVFAKLLKFIILFKAAPHSLEPLSHSQESIFTMFKQYSQSVLQSLKFPKAAESNVEVSLISQTALFFTTSASTNLKSAEKLDCTSIIENGLYKSYQDTPTMKLWLVHAIQGGPSKLKTVVAAFKVYSDYVKDDKILHGEYSDLWDVINSFTFTLKYLTQFPDMTQELFDKFKKWLAELVVLTELYLSKLGSNNYGVPLTKHLARLWFEIGLFHKFTSIKSTPTVAILQERLTSTATTFEKSIQLVDKLTPKDLTYAEYYYEYALSLIKLNKKASAVKNIRSAMRLDPNCVKYLNLACLLYSTSEDQRERAYTISRDVMAHLQEYIGQAADPSKEYTVSEKYDILQLGMTWIALIESELGLRTALQSLDELFALVHLLMGMKTEEATITQGVPNRTPAGIDVLIEEENISPAHRPSIVINRDGKENFELSRNTSVKSKNQVTRVLSRVASTTKKAANKAGGGARKLKNDARDGGKNKLKKLDDVEKKLIQDVWLFASKLFEKDTNFEDAKICIGDAEQVYKKTYQTHARLGQLYTICGDLKQALQEFELSLDLNETADNFEAIIGFTNLILNQNANTETIFFSDQDKESAVARAKNYLYCLTTSYHWFQHSEIYLCLGSVLEWYGDEEAMGAALWRCVSLEESRAVRALPVPLPLSK
ncbi:unnamed protein product [Ambrosiozyma monospora]|uniref:Cargo-transport protein YPP1 n=1 Tax=Ambrosiozyma monospora TaxID=43982 RepID=A0A9W7DC63_AMBMO|nr:unnamed protein product [Ambrosiozyma monospora]